MVYPCHGNRTQSAVQVEEVIPSSWLFDLTWELVSTLMFPHNRRMMLSAKLVQLFSEGLPNKHMV